MGKLIRFIGYSIGLVLILMVGLSIALPLILDPNDLKEPITKLVQDKTGRQLTLGGDIGLTVFPWLGIELADVQLSNAEGFGESPFARVDTAKVRVKLLPLLRKQIEMDTATLEGLQLNLSKDKAGHTNWSDLTGATDEPSADKGRSIPELLTGLAVSGIRLRDSRIVWDDRMSGSRYVVDGLSLNTGALQLESPFEVSIAFQLQSDQPTMRSDIKISGAMRVSSSLQQWSVTNLKTVINAQGETLPGGQVEGSLRADMQVDIEKQLLDLAGLIIDTMGLQLSGNFHATSILGNVPGYSGTLDVQQFVPREVIKALGQEVPNTADTTALGKADAHLEIKGDTNSVQIAPLKMRFDDSVVAGKFGVKNFKTPAIEIDLNVDAVDLDRYLPPPAKSKGQATGTPATAAAAGAGAVPVEMLRNLDLSGNLQIGKLTAFGIHSSDVNIELRARDGKLRMHPATAKMYQGAYSGDIAMDASGSVPHLSMNESVSSVQVGPLLQDFSGDDKISGTADVKLQLSSTGADLPALRKRLNGKASFSFTDGAVKGVNIAQLIREAKARLEGKPVPSAQGPNQTDFTELGGSATVSDGVVRNDDFEAKSPLLRIVGKGSVDLVAETIDYLLTVKLVSSLKGQGGEGLDSLQGVGIPLRVGGTFAKPTYRPDLEAAFGEAVKTKVEEKKGEIKEKLEEKLEEKLKGKVDDQLKEQIKGGLKGLF